MGSWAVRARVVVLSSCVVSWGVLLACNSNDDENPATPRVSTPESGSSTTNPASVDGSSLTADALCANFGGYDGVKQLATQIIAKATQDCRIGGIVGAASGGDKSTHFMDCFDAFLGGGFQCSGITYQQDTTVDSKGNKCESILPGLEFTDADWKAFADFNASPDSAAKAVMVAANANPADLQAVAEIFVGKQSTVRKGDVDETKFTQCAASCDIGKDACIPDVVDSGTRDSGADTGTPDSGGSSTKDSGSDTGAPSDSGTD